MALFGMARAEALNCPTCGALRVSAEDAQGFHTCEYCAARFRLKTASARPAAGAEVSRAADVLAVARRARKLLLWIALGGAVITSMVIAIDELTKPKPSRSVVTPSARPSDAPAQLPATCEFAFHHVADGVDGAQWIYGLVRNTSKTLIAKPKITVIFLDDKGKELGTDSGFAEWDVLEPSEASPVSILANHPPRYAKLAFETETKAATYIPAQAQGLKLEAHDPELDGTRAVFKGKVENGGARAARFVRVDIVAYDAERKIVGMGYAFAGGDRLEPGQSARYEAELWRFAGKPVDFDVTVRGMPAE